MGRVSELVDHVGESTATVRNAPVIVLGYSGSGADRLSSLLSGFPELACTQGTGILPLCHQSVSAWQVVDGRGGPGIPPLASASVRSLCGGMMTVILARSGGTRWCEFTNAPPAAAQTFARLYPGTRFLVVYARADTMTRTIIGSGRWGLEGQEFAHFVSAHPESPVAALARYWATRTAWQLEFEEANPGICYRVHADDLVSGTARIFPEIRNFLDLGNGYASLSFSGDDPGIESDALEVAPGDHGLPLDRIPEPLLARVNELHRILGYSPVADAGSRLDGQPRRDWT